MSESLSVQVHPLVLLNMADHLTRQKYRQKESEVRVIGVVLGRQQGRLLEVVNTIEVKYTAQTPKGAAGNIEIDESFAKERIEAYKTMYADLECIGWYSVRGGPSCTGKKEFDNPTA